MAAVELENLCKKFTFSKGWGFNRRRTEIIAVDDISLSVPDGQAIASIDPMVQGSPRQSKC
jgi:ABC-2 type transport system ATP-binding protein